MLHPYFYSMLVFHPLYQHVTTDQKKSGAPTCQEHTRAHMHKSKVYIIQQKKSPQAPFPIPRLQPHWLNSDWRLFNHLQENVCAYLKAEKIEIRFWSGLLIMKILWRNIELITCHLHLQRKLQVTSTWFYWNSIRNLITTVYQSIYIFFLRR